MSDTAAKMHDPVTCRNGDHYGQCSGVTMPLIAERTCPPSAVHDMILPWSDVREGDLVVWDGEFRLITCKFDYAGKPMMWFDGSKVGGVTPCGTYAAVRRYDTGEESR